MEKKNISIGDNYIDYSGRNTHTLYVQQILDVDYDELSFGGNTLDTRTQINPKRVIDI